MEAAPAIKKTNVIDASNRVPEWVMPMVRAGVFGFDAFLTALCFFSAFTLREGDPILSSSAWAWSQQFVPYAGILLFAVPARLAMLLYFRAYRFEGAFSYLQEAIKIFKATLVSSLLIVTWAFLFRGGFAFREFSYSRAVFLVDFALALIGFTIFHIVVRFVQTRVRERGINLIPTLVVGTTAEARRTVQELNDGRYLGYRVIGIVSGRDETAVGHEIVLDGGERIPLVGSIDELADLIGEHNIHEVIITDDTLEIERLFEAMMRICRRQKVEFRFAPSIFNLLPQKTSVEQIGVLPMVRLFREPLSDAQRFIKRASDVVIASTVTVLTMPLWVLVAIVIRVDSRGPILFKQERVGMDGRRFLCYKFRTMLADADESLHRDAYLKNIEGQREANAGDEDKPVFGKVKNDPRITAAGKWLRRTSIDELPQFLNVFRGEMSVVGPRPPIPYEVEQYELWHRKRLDVKPGITGLWQVSGRNRLTFDEMVRVDLYYIENWSLLLDIKIILMTLPAMFRGDGAR
ncbi:MAG: sugar transferase [Pyrinomonadaceae bacterium]|nr:sugar transferase [Pyrinomonadaceae bacterium]MBP9108442.1 sugar transferase [Pyrinomonadaceae bacterium]